jgi:ABC-type Fe3+ transport system substrate-binding protein
VIAATRLVAAGTTDVRSVREIIWQRFVAASGTSAELDYRQDVSTTRLLAAVQEAPEGSRPDLVFVSDPAEFVEAGLAEPLDAGSASASFPHGWLDPDNRWWPLYVQPVVAVHNAYRGEPPRNWLDLGDARFRDRLCFEEPWRMVTTGPALAELSGAMDEQTWRSFIDSIVAQRPLVGGDNERTVLEVATGSRWVGLSNWNVSLRVRKSSPVKRIFLDPTPCIPGFGVLVPGGSSHELGRQFLQWLRSEDGQQAYSATGRVPAMLEIDAPTALRNVLPDGVSGLYGATDWVARPQPWVERFRDLFGDVTQEVRDAKLS